MPSPTHYRSLTDTEQIALILRLADFIQQSLPALTSTRHYTKDLIAIFQQGLDILSHFPKASTFYIECSRMKTGYERQASRMSFLMNLIKRDLSHELPIAHDAIVLPQSQTLRRGRPTAEESAQRAAEKILTQRAAALSTLTGLRVISQDAAPIDTSRPTDTSRRHRDTDPTLFDSLLSSTDLTSTSPATDSNSDHSPSVSIDQVDSPSSPVSAVSPAVSSPVSAASPAVSSPVSAASPAVSSPVSDASPSDSRSLPTLPTLRDWFFLLPDSLVSQAKSIKDLRAQRASAAERAKQLFESGESEHTVAQYTQQAKSINKKITDILNAIDQHLATAYVLLNDVNPDYGKWAQKYEKRGGLPSLLSDLLPYYHKVISKTSPSASPSVSIDQVDSPHPLPTPSPSQESSNAVSSIASSLLQKATSLNAASLRDPEKEKELHRIYSYFKRKDCTSTPERLNKLNTYYARATELGADPDTLSAYRVIIAKVTSDITPS